MDSGVKTASPPRDCELPRGRTAPFQVGVLSTALWLLNTCSKVRWKNGFVEHLSTFGHSLGFAQYSSLHQERWTRCKPRTSTQPDWCYHPKYTQTAARLFYGSLRYVRVMALHYGKCRGGKAEGAGIESGRGRESGVFPSLHRGVRAWVAGWQGGVVGGVAVWTLRLSSAPPEAVELIGGGRLCTWRRGKWRAGLGARWPHHGPAQWVTFRVVAGPGGVWDPMKQLF